MGHRHSGRLEEVFVGGSVGQVVTIYLTILLVTSTFTNYSGDNNSGGCAINVYRLIRRRTLSTTAGNFGRTLVRGLNTSGIRFGRRGTNNSSTAYSAVAGNFISRNISLVFTGTAPTLRTTVRSAAAVPVINASVASCTATLSVSRDD